jgi:hypothetical protein
MNQDGWLCTRSRQLTPVRDKTRRPGNPLPQSADGRANEASAVPWIFARLPTVPR